MPLSNFYGAILGFLPILIVLILMIRFSLPAFKAMPIGWLTASILAIFIWRTPFQWVTGATFKGFMIAIDILLIVFGAVLLYFTMLEGGAIRTISRTVVGMSKDRRIQANLAWLLCAFFEGVAGFGTPGAIVGPLLFGMGFPAIVSAGIVLIFNSTPVSFGCIGIPVWGGVGGSLRTEEFQRVFSLSGIEFNYWVNVLLTRYVALIHGIIGTFLPLFALYLFIKWTGGEKEDFKEGMVPALLAGLSFTIPYTLSAFLLGPEFPSLFGSLSAIVIYYFLIKSKIVKVDRIYDFSSSSERVSPRDEGKYIPEGKAFLPYILIALILFITRAFPGIKRIVEGNIVIEWRRILGTEISQSLKLLNNPGLYFLVVAIISSFFFKMKKDEIKDAWIKTVKRLAPASVALLFALALSQTMIYTSKNPFNMSSMIVMIAKGISSLTGKFYSLFAPFVGVLGAYIAGSNTVSNIMFSGFQFATAGILGLPRTIILALQVIGGAVGNMICVHNVVAVCATVGIIGREGIIIKKNLFPSILYSLLAGGIGTFLIILSPKIF